jgi:hypothetical protein
VVGDEGSSDCESFVDLQFAKALIRLQTWRQLSNAVPSMPSLSVPQIGYQGEHYLNDHAARFHRT